MALQYHLIGAKGHIGFTCSREEAQDFARRVEATTPEHTPVRIVDMTASSREAEIFSAAGEVVACRV